MAIVYEVSHQIVPQSSLNAWLGNAMQNVIHMDSQFSFQHVFVECEETGVPSGNQQTNTSRKCKLHADSIHAKIPLLQSTTAYH